MPSIAYIFMLHELSLATLFLYSELQLYFWSQPAACLPFSHPSVSFPSLHHSFCPSFRPFILPSILPSICMFVWLKAIQGRKTLAVGLLFLEPTLWETFSKSSITLRWVCIQKWGEVLIWETDLAIMNMVFKILNCFVVTCAGVPPKKLTDKENFIYTNW